MVGLRTVLLAAVSAAAFMVSGIAASAASAETTWLCKPGIANNPCLSSQETTVELSNGASFVEHAKPAANPPIDCFYVYPTVSSQFTTNANLNIDPEERQIAIDQASRFSQACKVYAPIYPQITLFALNTGKITPAASLTAYIGVLTAFEEYLAVYNHGRGFVLLGHSQGTSVLRQLIKEQIDPNPALRKQLVSADLLGGNVLVPKGGTVGADFKNVPTCQFAGQTHCVVAYSSFLKEPPNPSLFGRVNSPLAPPIPEEIAKNLEVMCVNPAALFQGGNPSGPLFRYESTSPFPGLLGAFVKGAKGTTPWVAMPAEYNGQCQRANGATWLQLTLNNPSDQREMIEEVLGPLWGTHLEDVNVGLGNLVALTGAQSFVYGLESH
jgi:hypothetical protein